MTKALQNDTALPFELFQKERAVIDILYHQDEQCYEQAETLLREALAMAGNHPHRANLLKRLSKLCRLQGRWDEAETYIREAILVSADALGLIALETARLRAKLVKIFDWKFRNESDGPARARREVRRYYDGAIDAFKRTQVVPERRGYDAVLKLELALYFAEGDRLKEETQQLLEQIIPELLSASETIGAMHAGEAAKMLGYIYFMREEYRSASLFLSQALDLLGPSHEASCWLRDRIRDCEKERGNR